MNTTNNYSLTFDAAGNQTDDGKDYKYEYDAFYRLRKVKQTGNSALVAEYRYNGLGYKIAVHEDTDTDADVDSNDKWYYDAFDERWRHAARFRESDTNPKEEFVAHTAGLGGGGSSSYIDGVVSRYRDANTTWTNSSDGVLEERSYLCNNQHADICAIMSSGGTQREGARYSAYGAPYGLPGGDVDSDGDCDSADSAATSSLISTAAYDSRADLDLDGDVDATDQSDLISFYFGVAAGRGVLSACGSRRGYSAYEQETALSLLARNRNTWPELGRWGRRDPLAYVDGPNLFAYVQSDPTVLTDPSGLSPCAAVWSVDNPASEGFFIHIACSATPGECVRWWPDTDCKFNCRLKLRMVDPGEPPEGPGHGVGHDIPCPMVPASGWFLWHTPHHINRSLLTAPGWEACNQWHGGRDVTWGTQPPGFPAPNPGSSEHGYDDLALPCGGFNSMTFTASSGNNAPGSSEPITLVATLSIACSNCGNVWSVDHSLPPPPPEPNW